MKAEKKVLFTVMVLLGSLLILAWVVFAAQDEFVYLPMVIKPEAPPAAELRGVWVTRFDWTAWNGASQSKIDEIVTNVADAGFNVIFFQVRGAADAYYDSSLEPWASRASGVYGQPPDPYWDPLAYMVEKAHAAGVQVHAYINVYTTAVCTPIPDATVSPTPLYHQLITAHGATIDGEVVKPNGLQWLEGGSVYCSGDQYLWASPASAFHDFHVINVALDIADRYDIDGLHLDRIRYSGSRTSCDPVSVMASGTTCFTSAPFGFAGYEDWQRSQVDDLVRRFYNEVIAAHPDLWLSAAVWPIHELDPAWGFPGSPIQGYHHYYQDSKEWLAAATIDSISPMIYPGAYNECDEDGHYVEDPSIYSSDYWLKSRWQILVDDFQAERNGRYIIPGIGADYCDFAEIEARINMAREIGAAGHALFSYGALAANGYFDDLAAGPYAETAVVPPIPWRITGSE